MNSSVAQRASDLEALAIEEGIILPYSPEMIARMEETGAVVNLLTGAILPGEADRPYKWSLTVLGEALGVVLAYESEGQL